MGGESVELQVLGPVLVRQDGQATALPGRLQRVLLGVLLVRANQPVSVDALACALWGERPDPRSGQKLQLHVHRLRGVLAEPDRLSFGPAGYRLRVLPGELDAQRFASLFEQGREVAGENPQRAVELLRAALDLWHGTPFGDLDVPVLADWSQRLVELRLVALETLYEAELACGLDAAIIGELADLVSRYPVRERLHGLLMTALYRSGRQAEALRAYRTARDALVDELGVEPGPELRELHRRVLAGEPLGPDEPAPSSAVPAQLPMDVRGFVGRDAELAELDGLLAASPAAVISAVAGTAGVGKTALAVRWAHRVRERFPDGQLYVDLRGYGPDQPVSPEDALAGFLRALGLDGAAIPQDIAERAARFRTLVAGSRMLIVLDNARTVEQLRPMLPGGSSCFVLVTSRDALAGLVAREGAHRLDLDRLPGEDARALLRERLGDRVDTEPGAARALVERCARLPLALRIAAELIRSRPGRALREFVAELACRQGALDLLDADGDPHTAVRAVFSWSYQRLDTVAARMFRLLGLHPGHDTDDHAAAALAGVGLRETRRALDVLRRAHLVESTPDGRHQPHDLLRAYAAELTATTDSADERAAALGRLAGHYLSVASAAMDVVARDDYARRPTVSPPGAEAPVFAAYDDAWRWLDTERANLLAVSRQAPTVIQMSETVWRYLDTGGYYDDAVALHTRALAAARGLGEERAEANARRVLGVTMSRMGSGQDAIDHLEWALAAFRRAGDEAFEAATLSFLGCVYQSKGELAEAARLFERALELTDPDGCWYLHCAVTINQSRTLLSLGRAEDAMRHLDAAFALCRDDRDKHIECNALLTLSKVYVHFGRDEDAFSHACRSLTLAREGGFRPLEADCLGVIGEVYRRRGDEEQALRLHEESVALARAVGDRELIAETLNTLATTLACAGRAAEALRCHDDALDVATEWGQREELARAHAGIGDVHAGLGEPDRARGHWLQALAVYRELRVPKAAEMRARLDRLDSLDGDKRAGYSLSR